jgi:hypothetical protein
MNKLTALEYAAYCNYELALQRGNLGEARLALDELHNGERCRRRRVPVRFAFDERGTTMRSHDRGRLTRDEEEELADLPEEELVDLVRKMAEASPEAEDALGTSTAMTGICGALAARTGVALVGTNLRRFRGGRGRAVRWIRSGRSRTGAGDDLVEEKRRETEDRHRRDAEDRRRRLAGDAAPGDRDFYRRFPEAARIRAA